MSAKRMQKLKEPGNENTLEAFRARQRKKIQKYTKKQLENPESAAWLRQQRRLID